MKMNAPLWGGLIGAALCVAGFVAMHYRRLEWERSTFHVGGTSGEILIFFGLITIAASGVMGLLDWLLARRKRGRGVERR